MRINTFSILTNYKNTNNNKANIKSINKLEYTPITDTFTFRGDIAKQEEGEWKVIPCYDKDPENYEANAKQLKKILKKRIYCGKIYPKTLLKTQTYHIYMTGNKPAVVIATEDDNIKDIRSNVNGDLNDRYLDIVNQYIENNKLKPSKNAELTLEVSKYRKDKYDKYKNDLKCAIRIQNAEKIFNYFNIKTDTDRFGNMTISEYKQPDSEITYKALGIDENKLLSRVVTIEGDADFRKSKLTSPGAVEYIGGNAIFSSSDITNLDKIEVIEGDAYLNASKVNDLGNLEFIGGNANFRNSNITSLKNLEHIGGNAFFRESKVKDLGKLKYIGGEVTFINSPLTKKDFANIKHKKESTAESFPNEPLESELLICGEND